MSVLESRCGKLWIGLTRGGALDPHHMKCRLYPPREILAKILQEIIYHVHTSISVVHGLDPPNARTSVNDMYR